jgi:NitT/TauT family transport system substrate-binding protein
MTRLLTLAAAALVALAPAPAAAQTKTPVTLLINFYVTNEHAPLAYGLEKGIYAEEGIDLTIKEGTGSGPTVNAIIGDSARFGFADAGAMARAVSKDAPLRMIGNYVQTSPQAIIFFADKNIRSLKDLAGKKVSFTAGDALHLNWPLLLKLNGMDRGQVQEVLLAPAAKQTAVITGTVDAMGGYYTSQAGVIERETKRKVGWLRYSDYGVNTMTLGLFINTKYAADRSLNCRMVRATSRAWAASVKDPDAAVDALHRRYPQVNKGAKDLTREQWLQTADHLYTKRSKGKQPGWMEREDWADLLSLLGQQGGLDRAKAPDEYFTNEYVDCK